MDYIDPLFCGRWTGRSATCGTCSECELTGKLSTTYNQESNTFLSTDGCPYSQIPQDLPFLKYFYTDWEITFNTVPYVCWANEHMNLAYGICIAYLLLIFGGQYVLKNYKPYGLRSVLSAWNLFLSIFSLIGFLRTAPHLFYYMYARDKGFYYSVCMPAETNFGQGATGFWTMLFIFSKVPELLDTGFIVLRKNKLIFLHWYHHITVLLFCWHSYATRSSAGLYFASMNYGVHALMYYYYFLTSLGYKKISWAPLVTTLQICQMFVGICICATIYYYQSSYSPYTEGCDVSPENFWACLLMYISYFMLFIWFAIEKYIFSPPSTATMTSNGNTVVTADITSSPSVNTKNRVTSNSTGTLRQRNVQ